MSRLRKDASGNILAITAAAIFPMIAMVGGAIDVGRLYAVKTRIQAACDAGALAGRKTMGGGTWAANSNRANTAANNIFSLNFKPGQFGSTGLTTTFTESNGTVTGTATVAVPMTLMALFGNTDITQTVTCNSQMRIPHSDVMFVLDVTGSMNCAPTDQSTNSSGANFCTNNGGTEKTDSKMVGLRKAVKCFYEALAKLDAGESCTTGEATGQPNTGISSAIQLRFGFMPYSSNVNVGKLLPTAYFANSRPFQAREPVTTQQWAYTVGSWYSTGSYGTWSTPPATYNSATGYGGWTTPPASPASGRTVAGTPWARQNSASNQTNCNNLNDLAGSGSTLKAREDTSPGIYNTTKTADSPNAPTHNGTVGTPEQTRNLTENDPRTVRAARYVWKDFDSTGNKCWLEVGSNSYSRTRSGVIEKRPVTWTAVQRLDGWTLKQTTLNIGGLKSGTNWNSSVAVPNMGSTTQSYNMSGSAVGTMTTLNIVGPKTVDWNGCIEDAQTFQNTDGNPLDDWNPVPSTAFDMKVNLIPDSATPATLWGPALPDLFYRRLSGSGGTSGSRTMSNVSVTGATSTAGEYFGVGTTPEMACPAEASKLKSWTAAAFKTYVDGLFPTGGTYHDLGMLWGARFISPTGIFASENAVTTLSGSSGAQIARHIVFMTDGDTGTCSTNYTPYGVSWYDRRQTNKASPSDDTGATSCTNTHTNEITDARTEALCKYIKNDMNITLWVVSYGNGVNAATVTRLQQCASSTTKHYETALNTPALITKFQEIAAEIARLRLTS